MNLLLKLHIINNVHKSCAFYDDYYGYDMYLSSA